MGFYLLAQDLPWRFKGNIGKVLSWPCYGLGFIFLASGLFAILWSMFGPIVPSVLSLLNWLVGRL
jgi:hypothetical protein